MIGRAPDMVCLAELDVMIVRAELELANAIGKQLRNGA